MTGKGLLEQLQKMTPEELEGEVIFTDDSCMGQSIEEISTEVMSDWCDGGPFCFMEMGTPFILMST